MLDELYNDKNDARLQMLETDLVNANTTIIRFHSSFIKWKTYAQSLTFNTEELIPKMRIK